MGRQAAGARGRRGEELAARLLARRGLVVLERNVRCRLGEVDLVAREGRTLVFVEVKTRRADAPEPPEVAVDARKRARLGRLALGYLAARRLGEGPCRFDVVAVTLGADGEPVAVRHHRGAFGLEGRPG
jgi:putative endonuclease